jgi:hypothetical protein
MQEGWALLELMGHRRLAGIIAEETIAGAAFIRIDVPAEEEEPGATQFYSPQAVYCITPLTEETARAFARTYRPEPIKAWELKALPGPERDLYVSTELLAHTAPDDPFSDDL